MYLLEGGKRGAESYFRDRIVSRLKSLMFTEGDRSMMNVDSFYAPEDSARNACDAARSVPFFGGKNIAVIYDADRYREGDLGVLAKYLENPNPHCVLIVTGKKFDRRKKFYKTISKTAEIISIEPPYDNLLPEYVRACVKSQGKSIDEAAVTDLIENIGGDLGRLIMEVEKLALFIGEENLISAAHVRELVGLSREENSFHLCEAILAGDTQKALEILKILRQGGSSVQEITAVLRWQLERLWRGRDLIDQGGGSDSITRQLGVHPRFAAEFLSSVRKFSVGKLQRGYEQVLETDWNTRQTATDTDVAMDLLMVSLCRD